jgi:hypothetical protein
MRILQAREGWHLIPLCESEMGGCHAEVDNYIASACQLCKQVVHYLRL